MPRLRLRCALRLSPKPNHQFFNYLAAPVRATFMFLQYQNSSFVSALGEVYALCTVSSFIDEVSFLSQSVQPHLSNFLFINIM